MTYTNILSFLTIGMVFCQIRIDRMYQEYLFKVQSRKLCVTAVAGAAAATGAMEITWPIAAMAYKLGQAAEDVAASNRSKVQS